MRHSLFTFVMLSACRSDGDVQFVAMESGQTQLSRAQVQLDAWLLDDCSGGTETLYIGQQRDLLAEPILPTTLPGGHWCGLGVQFAPVDDALDVEGTSPDGNFSWQISPNFIPIPAEFTVDGDEWVLVLEAENWVEEIATLSAQGTEPEVAAVQTLRDHLWFGPLWQARDVIYIDLWPFPDIVFQLGVGDPRADGPAGCRGGEIDSPSSETATTIQPETGTAPYESGEPSDEYGSSCGSGCNGVSCNTPTIPSCNAPSGCNDSGGCDCKVGCSTLGWLPPSFIGWLGFVVARRSRKTLVSSLPEENRS